jgi:Tfp pilus assembly protein PilF
VVHLVGQQSDQEEIKCMTEPRASKRDDPLSQVPPKQAVRGEDLCAQGRGLALLGCCAFQRQQWQEAEDSLVRALAIFAQQKEALGAGQSLAQRDQWCEAQTLLSLGAMLLHVHPSSQHLLEGIQCLSLAYEIALRLEDQELVNDVLKAQTRLSRGVRRPRVGP